MKQINVLVPDLPSAEALLPYLKIIDRNRWYTNHGPLVAELELRIKRLFFSGIPVELATTSSGTTAIELAIQAIGLHEGCKVLVPSYTFPATVTAILRNRLIPIFCDVDENTWCLTAESARLAKHRSDISLVIPVTTFGNPLPTKEWATFSAETATPVVIDSSAALGAQRIESGLLYCFSLHATKPFCCSEGGLVVSSDQHAVETVRLLTNFGFVDNSISLPGTNAKMSEYHAAVGLAQLERWSGLKQTRARYLETYRNLLDSRQVTFQDTLEGYIPSVLMVKINEELDIKLVSERLKNQGIATRRWYTPACHQHRSFSDYNHVEEYSSLGNTIRLTEQSIGLPFHTLLTEEDIERVASTFTRVIAGVSRQP